MGWWVHMAPASPEPCVAGRRRRGEGPGGGLEQWCWK